MLTTSLTLFPAEEEVLVSGQASIVERQLVPISGFHDIIADEIDQFADLDTRLLEIVDERLSEGTVVSGAIHRDLAGSSGVNHHSTRLGFDRCKPSADDRTRGQAGRALHCSGEWVVTAGIEQHKVKLFCPFRSEHHMVERDSFETHVAIGCQLCVDWNQVVRAADLYAMACIIDHSPVGGRRLLREALQCALELPFVEIIALDNSLEPDIPQ